MDAHVRPARVDDGPALQELERRAGERFRDVGLAAIADDDPPTIEVLAALAAAGRGWVAVVPDDDAGERPVGYVVVEEVDGCAHVDQITVHPDHQGQGVGRALLDAVRAWATAGGRPAITLTTFAEVPWNGPLYAHLGFEELHDHEIGAALRRVIAAEHDAGLDADSRRIAMVLRLAAP